MVDASSVQRLKGILSVTVLKATNLAKSDWLGENDCYVVISLEPFPIDMKSEIQTETYQKTQIHDGSNPVFNEKFAFSVSEKLETLYVQVWDKDKDKDDLLAYGTLNLIDDEQGGIYDMNTDKEWLHITRISLMSDKSQSAGTLDLVLHYIPETIINYMNKKFDAAQAEVKKKLTQQIVAKVTDVATDKIRGYVGIGV
ncbi:hypothetical protein I4U23_003742 [Adineta vaga]|nr:hypothetical protein I4U23_003742 [Adineta vaga]